MIEKHMVIISIHSSPTICVSITFLRLTCNDRNSTLEVRVTPQMAVTLREAYYPERSFKYQILCRLLINWSRWGVNTKARCSAVITVSSACVVTSVLGPQAEVGLPVELYYTFWLCVGVEHVLLLVPRSLVICRQLTLHIQVRHRCQKKRKNRTNRSNVNSVLSFSSSGALG